MKNWLPWLVVVALLLLPEAAIAQGCAMCKAVAGEADVADRGAGSLAAGLNKGILIMMFAPYILIFLFLRKRIVSFWKQLASA